MGGFLRGKIETYVYTGNRLTQAEVLFKNLYDFFTSHPNYTLIALRYGSTTALPNTPTGGSGTGTGYYDQPNSFGYNGWFLVRQNATTLRPFDVYHFFQWAGSNNQSGAGTVIGQAPGSPALINGSTTLIDSNRPCIGYACAIGLGGTGGSALSPNNGNPWRGSTNANGADTKASPVWGAPGGGGNGVTLFPRSNNDFGAHRQLGQNLGAVWCSGGADNLAVRMHIVADDDSFAIAIDNGDAGAYCVTYSGIFTPRANHNIPYPYCSIISFNNLPWVVTLASVYGDIVGTQTQQGGITHPLSGSSASLQLDHMSVFTSDANFWPDFTFASPVFNEFTIPVGIYEPYPTQRSGLLGQIEFIKEMFAVPTNTVKDDYSKIFLGSLTLNERKYSIPWDKPGQTIPRTGDTREGVNFVYDPGA